MIPEEVNVLACPEEKHFMFSPPTFLATNSINLKKKKKKSLLQTLVPERFGKKIYECWTGYEMMLKIKLNFFHPLLSIGVDS